MMLKARTMHVEAKKKKKKMMNGKQYKQTQNTKQKEGGQEKEKKPDTTATLNCNRVRWKDYRDEMGGELSIYYVE